MLQLIVELGDQVLLQRLLPVLPDVDVDEAVLSEHGLTLGEHHHWTHCEVLKLVLPQQALGGQDEQHTKSSADLTIGLINIIGDINFSPFT